MSNSEEFEKYVAAVEMATLASEGSGELNAYDHVAKDLFREGFDTLLEKTPDLYKTVFRSKHHVTITDLMIERYYEDYAAY